MLTDFQCIGMALRVPWRICGELSSLGQESREDEEHSKGEAREERGPMCGGSGQDSRTWTVWLYYQSLYSCPRLNVLCEKNPFSTHVAKIVLANFRCNYTILSL